ncbi:uncharacterized protein LOC121105845 [Ursus maritimus]|uniref:Uncharacterized protein LOC121105845 n=1 Tax=Ursus maritimus TaxID=29073 RepID=A0A8M1GWU3_URSMA|nr:uncharacterized protein LOC121105845 [Ursus maritimus]
MFQAVRYNPSVLAKQCKRAISGLTISPLALALHLLPYHTSLRTMSSHCLCPHRQKNRMDVSRDTRPSYFGDSNKVILMQRTFPVPQTPLTVTFIVLPPSSDLTLQAYIYPGFLSDSRLTIDREKPEELCTFCRNTHVQLLCFFHQDIFGEHFLTELRWKRPLGEFILLVFDLVFSRDCWWSNDTELTPVLCSTILEAPQLLFTELA